MRIAAANFKQKIKCSYCRQSGHLSTNRNKKLVDAYHSLHAISMPKKVNEEVSIAISGKAKETTNMTRDTNGFAGKPIGERVPQIGRAHV